MPVARKAAEAPQWNRFSAFGIFQVNSVEDIEMHFHDADECWLIFQGRAVASSEGKHFEIGPGDVLFTKMGDYHGLVELLEAPLRGFYIEDELKGRKRPGHLHKEDE
jgi:mannose-6-phosphate isomerase-like protein (cupin superfamily)